MKNTNKLPPVGARHVDLTNGECKVVVTPVKWRSFKGEISVTQACAFCKTCGWDTPTLFSMSAAEAAAKKHLGLIPLSDLENRRGA